MRNFVSNAEKLLTKMEEAFPHSVVIAIDRKSDKWQQLHRYMKDKYGDDALPYPNSNMQRSKPDSGWSYNFVIIDQETHFYFDDQDIAVEFMLRFG